MEGSEEKFPTQFIKSFGDIQTHANSTSSGLGFELLEEVMGQGNMVVDISTFNESKLVVWDKLGEDTWQSGSQDSGDDFICEI